MYSRNVVVRKWVVIGDAVWTEVVASSFTVGHILFCGRELNNSRSTAV